MYYKGAEIRRDWSPVDGKGMRIQDFVRLRTRTPALRDMNTTPMRAVVAAHATAAVAPTPEEATLAFAASAPIIVAAAVAPASLRSAPVLRILTPVVRVVM